MMAKVSVSFTKLNDILIEEQEENQVAPITNSIDKPSITIKNLNFKYNGNSKNYNLKDINLNIKFGEHIGIAGRNGSGKSTLVKLLVNLYKDYEGEIYLNNTEVRQIPLSLLRKKIFLFSQETSLFAGSIRDNILIANPDADEKQLVEAGKLADLHNTVKKLYLGYNHYTGDNGNTLSGGQKVKIAFARLFISNPDIIILDEAGSALDMESEKTITDNLKKTFKDKTIITIAHRLHTLESADKILFLDNGCIVEQGSHRELVAGKGKYFNMIKNHITY
jgi:ATP-binding cassette subfamily B protein